MSLRIVELAESEAPEPGDRGGLGTMQTEHGNLPLRGLSLQTRVTGATARTVVTQRFVNPHDDPIEAVYIFPLPERAAVTAMTMTVAERTVVAQLQERAAARKTYKRAVEQGKRAAIAEAERADVFTMRVGNILPGEEAEVELTLVGPLAHEDGEFTLRLPLVVAPRYIPGQPRQAPAAGAGHAWDTDAVPDASRITPPVLLPGFPNPVDLSIEVTIDPAGLPLTQLASSLHVTQSQTDPDSGLTRVRIHPGERVDRDFVLRFSHADEDEFSSTLATASDLAEDPVGPGTFQLTATPPRTSASRQPDRDVVVLLDRSGSMRGWKLVAARRAASRIVDTLGSADRFAVRCFDTHVTAPENMEEGLFAASDRNRFQAVQHLAGVNSRGGTAMLQPLREAVDLLHSEKTGRQRIVVLVTDGQVGNEDQILAELSGRLTGIRVHVVGIDRAVNAGFLHRLALEGRGRCELVESEDRLDAAAAHIHRRILSPAATQLQLSAEDMELEDGATAPARTPDLFEGVPLTISGRYRALGKNPRLRLTGVDADGQPWETAVDAKHVDDDAVHAMWGRAHLRDLEDQYAAAPRTGVLERRHPDSPRNLQQLEEHIVRTSLRCHVLSRFTAFTAVDERVVTEAGQPRTVVQPVELPDGWERPRSAADDREVSEADSGAGGSASGFAPMMMAKPTAKPESSASTAATGRARTEMPGASSRRDTSRAAPGKSRGAARGRRSGRRGKQPLNPAQVREALATELQILDPEIRTMQWKPPETIARERRMLLSDLATRLGAVGAAVEQLPGKAEDVEALRALMPELIGCEGPTPPAGEDLEQLWQRTLTLLRRLVAEPDDDRSEGRTESSEPSGGAAPDNASSDDDPGEFWKRR